MVAEWTGYEWKRRIAFLQKRFNEDEKLKKWSASRINRSQNGYITLRCDALNLEYNDDINEIYMWRPGQRYGGGRIALSELNYLRDVLAEWIEEQKEAPIPRYVPIDKHMKEVWRIPKTTDEKKKKRKDDGQ